MSKISQAIADTIKLAQSNIFSSLKLIVQINFQLHVHFQKEFFFLLKLGDNIIRVSQKHIPGQASCKSQQLSTGEEQRLEGKVMLFAYQHGGLCLRAQESKWWVGRFRETVRKSKSIEKHPQVLISIQNNETERRERKRCKGRDDSMTWQLQVSLERLCGIGILGRKSTVIIKVQYF